MGQQFSAEARVKCTICKLGDVVAGAATVTLERGGTTVVIKAVPAGVCKDCGEKYVDEKTTRQLMAIADAAARNGVQVEVREFAVV